MGEKPWHVIWHYARALGRVLWACRVAFLAVSVPGALFYYSEAARDLFSHYWGHIAIGSEVPTSGADDAMTVLYWVLFSALVWVFWVYPVHSSSRIILNYPAWLFGRAEATDVELEDLGRYYRVFIVWVPRILAASVFVVLALAVWRAEDDLATPIGIEAGSPEAAMSERIEALLTALKIVFALLGLATLGFFAMRRGSMATAAPDTRPAFGGSALERYRAVIGDGDTIAREAFVGRIVLGYATVTLIVVLVWPDAVTRYFFLALIVPLLAGAWVPLFTWLAYWGHRYRFPFIACLFGIVALCDWQLGDTHDVSPAIEGQRLSMKEAVERWRTANGCATTEPAACPQPIIVSTAGGASRAAFFTNTVLGTLLDPPPGGAGMSDGEWAKRVMSRIFAISAVSGGATGAVIFSAAIANSPDGLAPCEPAAAPFWFKAGAPRLWRDCLQALSSEDFLSDTITGLMVRDNLSFLSRGPFRFEDRAEKLEGAWRSRFARMVKGGAQKGLDKPITEVGPTGAGQGTWQPILVTNGTSATTGRRIITSHLSPADARVFRDAYDLAEVLSGIPACTDSVCKEPKRLVPSLAGAAMNSARFPIVSPAGAIRKEGGDVVDRIVDGGYFENDGLTTTIDLVTALKEHKLDAAVLHIANNPVAYPAKTAGEGSKGALNTAQSAQPGWRHTSPQLPVVEDKSLFLFLRAPVGALLATRSARSTYASAALEDILRRPDGRPADDFAEILVYGRPRDGTVAFTRRTDHCFDGPATPPQPPFKAVSMSWWLSQPVQFYLDSQVLLSKNCDELNIVRGWLLSR